MRLVEILSPNIIFFRSIFLNLPLFNNSRVLPMVIGMHLYIAGANVHLITFALQAMIMCLLAIVLTLAKLYGTIIRRRESQEAMR